MGLSVGIVGLPNVGKSTTFNALTKAQNAESANYPFCTIEPNKDTSHYECTIKHAPSSVPTDLD